MNVEKNVSLSPPPEVGQIVQVRTRKFLVDRVEPASGAGSTLVGLLCLDDDAQGHVLDVVWEDRRGSRRGALVRLLRRPDVV